MATTTEHIPLVVTSEEKARIAQLAAEAGLSMSEFLRRAAEAFRPNDDTEILIGMIDQMLKTTAKANEAIDDALEFVDASNKRMAALDANRREH